jgi:DNA-binding SARP family transcriptional activator
LRVRNALPIRGRDSSDDAALSPVARRISLLGPPSIELDGSQAGGPSGRKAWGLLAYAALVDRPPTRQRLAELLFSEAADPLRALRWNLTQLRVALGARDVVGGDPLELRLGDADVLDAKLVLARSWPADEDLGGLGGELLEGLSFDRAPAFADWLDLERHHLRGATEALLVELAVTRGARGDHSGAAELARRAVALDEFNAGHHALLVRSLVAGGDEDAARAHVARCTTVYRDGLGAPMPAEIDQSLHGPAAATASVSGPAAAVAALDSGQAAISAGAVAYAVERLREAAALTEGTSDELRARALLGLGAALLHSAGDRSVSCAAGLQSAHLVAQECGQAQLAAEAARELGFLHVQMGQHARAEVWLERAKGLTTDPVEQARILGVQGQSRSDEGREDEALELLDESVQLARSAAAPRPEAWSLSMIGRIALLRGELGASERALVEALDLVARERWIAFAPWVQALRCEVDLRRGRTASADAGFERAYAAARTLDDNCWIAMNARGLALVRTATGDRRAALEWVRESLRRDPWYCWVHGYCLRAAVEIGTAAGAEETSRWQHELAVVTARAGLGRLRPEDANDPSNGATVSSASH